MSPLVRLASLTAPFRKSIALAVLLSFLTIAANMALMATSAYLISRAALVSEVATLSIAVTSVRVFAITRAVFRYLERLVSHGVTFRILAHLRAWLYEAIEPLAPARLTLHRSGDLLTRSLADIETLESFYVRVVVPPVAAALVVVFTCLFLSVFDWVVALILLLFLVLTGLVLPLIVRRLSQKTAANLVSTRAGLKALLLDDIQGVADLLVFDPGGDHRARVLTIGRALSHSQERLAGLRGLGNALGSLLAVLAAISVLALTIPLVNGGAIGGVYLAMLALVAIASFEAVQPLSAALQQGEASRAAGNRIFELVDAPPEVREPARPAPLPSDLSVEFRSVTFRYHPDDSQALDAVSFSLPAGSCLGIAGPSGSGKSTIVNLLLRFYQYQAGRITLGGRDLRAYSTDTVRSRIGVIPQNVHLFNTTLRDNLLLANPDATRAQIEAACRQSLLAEFIEALPKGYDTLVGENGLLLSGGERQRLAMARMVLKNAPIAILDEPTANLDAQTERRLMQSLEPFLSRRTVLLISHRPVVLGYAGRVVELSNGRVVQNPP